MTFVGTSVDFCPIGTSPIGVWAGELDLGTPVAVGCGDEARVLAGCHGASGACAPSFAGLIEFWGGDTPVEAGVNPCMSAISASFKSLTSAQAVELTGWPVFGPSEPGLRFLPFQVQIRPSEWAFQEGLQEDHQ